MSKNFREPLKEEAKEKQPNAGKPEFILSVQEYSDVGTKDTAEEVVFTRSTSTSCSTS